MWQEQVWNCVVSQWYFTSPCKPSVTTICRIQFTLDSSIFTQEGGMNKEQFNHRVPPLFSFPSHAEREWKERGKKMKERDHVKEITARSWNVWYTLGLWRGSAKPSVCVYVCDGMGVTLSSDGKHRRNVWSSIVIFLLCFLLFHVEEPQTTIFRKFPFFSYRIVSILW